MISGVQFSTLLGLLLQGTPNEVGCATEIQHDAYFSRRFVERLKQELFYHDISIIFISFSRVKSQGPYRRGEGEPEASRRGPVSKFPHNIKHELLVGRVNERRHENLLKQRRATLAGGFIM